MPVLPITVWEKTTTADYGDVTKASWFVTLGGRMFPLPELVFKAPPYFWLGAEAERV